MKVGDLVKIKDQRNINNWPRLAHANYRRQVGIVTRVVRSSTNAAFPSVLVVLTTSPAVPIWFISLQCEVL